MTDTTELAAMRRHRTTEGLGLWADAASEPTERHVAAIASVEASGLPGETAIVERVQAAIVGRGRGTRLNADLVAVLLTEEGVPREGAAGQSVRRRLASRVINSGRGKLWTKVGRGMTTDNVRSGREIAEWEVL